MSREVDLRETDGAHELLNGLASIVGCARTLLDSGDRLTADIHKELLEIILRQAMVIERGLREAV